MKIITLFMRLGIIGSSFFISCSGNEEADSTAFNNSASAETAIVSGGNMNVEEKVSESDIIKVTIASKEHSTLVKALQAAGLTNALSANGPFTLFAPTDDAFKELPPGTIDSLMKPENKDVLTKILYHHIQVSEYKLDYFKDGRTITMFDGTPVTIHLKNGKCNISDATVISAIHASNGVVYVTDQVILPPKK